MLQVQLHQAQTEQEALEETEEFTMPSPETTIPIEEFEELHMKLDETENKVNELESELAMKESTIAKLTAKADKLSTDLEKAKDQIERLKHDLTDQKRQSIAAASRASDLAGHQLAIMQEEMKAKIETAKKEAYEQALRDAEGQQDKDDGKFEKEVARRQALEEKLRKQQEHLQGDSAVTALKRLQRIEKEQKEEIARLKADLERLNKTWQMKFAVLQRTLHAVKDESYLRTSLHRQSSRLHHATVTYARDIPEDVLTKLRNRRHRDVLPRIEPRVPESYANKNNDDDYEDQKDDSSQLSTSPTYNRTQLIPTPSKPAAGDYDYQGAYGNQDESRPATAKGPVTVGAT